jgi:hypothetical protein
MRRGYGGLPGGDFLAKMLDRIGDKGEEAGAPHRGDV